MFRFIFPYPDGRVFNRAIGGKDLQAAYRNFARDHWLPELGAVGVWHNAALVARVRPVFDEETGQLKPVLQDLGI